MTFIMFPKSPIEKVWQISSSFNFADKIDMIPVMSDTLLDLYLRESGEFVIFSIRKDGIAPSAANRTVESQFHKKTLRVGGILQGQSIFIYSLTSADDICALSLLEQRLNMLYIQAIYGIF